MDDDVCYCGHVYDEHDPDDGLACAVEGCDCAYFDLDEGAALS